MNWKQNFKKKDKKTFFCQKALKLGRIFISIVKEPWLCLWVACDRKKEFAISFVLVGGGSGGGIILVIY